MGQAVLRLRKTVAAMFIQHGQEDVDPFATPNLTINDFLQLMMNMPQGTSLVSVNPVKTDPSTLYYEFEIIVENKIFVDGGELTVDYTREVAIIPGKDGLHQFSAFKGINYKRALANSENFSLEGVGEQARIVEEAMQAAVEGGVVGEDGENE